MKLNQFAVYRVDQQTAGKALWHLPYQEARQQNVSITVENYRVISIHEMQEEEKVADIWKRMKKQCEVSDVLVLNRDGEINCYYVDENYPQYLAGFIRINTSGALITMETENYQIDGKKGNWIATDTIIIDGKQFYLMEHQVYRDQAQGVILDAYGKMVVEECKKFDEKTKQKIHNQIQQQAPLNSVEQLKQDGKIRLEHYQKFYQNGTYERSRESGTEANYDMVDGLVNNQKKNPEKISDAHSNKQTSRNQQDNKPKKRRSVIKRLHQKQIAIARRSGKPIPKYLDQEMERKRGQNMRRLKCEKETIILTNEDDGFYDVYTFNQSLQKRLRTFAEKYPDDCWLKGFSEDGSETYMIRKGRLSLNLRPPYSKDRIHKATERIIEEQKEQSKDSQNAI